MVTQSYYCLGSLYKYSTPIPTNTLHAQECLWSKAPVGLNLQCSWVVHWLWTGLKFRLYSSSSFPVCSFLFPNCRKNAIKEALKAQSCNYSGSLTFPLTITVFYVFVIFLKAVVIFCSPFYLYPLSFHPAPPSLTRSVLMWIQLPDQRKRR